jgi:hypothetical protein
MFVKLPLKSKAVLLHAMEAHGGRGGIAPTPRHQMGVSGQRHAPAALYPQYPLDRRLGGPPEPVWTQRLEVKSSALVGDRTPIVQPVVGHYTAWATAAYVKC